ncbi:hypothetical protein PLESTB_001448300 [Pleodorina starrii]|uniref:Uncharacterized protein n=1 Tax=Pleodorina starrii TaxID=330485 RepID=A0A9W6F812_9CHLO|nr:hypothetical protein PLESTB_001448300 [Pleodorina starrii]GLC68285.1 hypothetical protein PLESTF_000671800 [Pleodorina starrii]
MSGNGCAPATGAKAGNEVDMHRHGRAGALPPYRYTLKHRWEIKLNFLSGITLLPWLKLLIRHGSSIDWLVYPHRVLFLSLMSVINTLLALIEWLLFSRAVAGQPLHPEPVFILGHPRTGTTHLHNLLANDPRFAFATTFHAGFPSSFLTLEPGRGLLSGLLEKRRPMDHMALHWDLPAEDEIAVNVLTGGDSPYMALVLPRMWRSLLRNYLTFQQATTVAGREANGNADGEADEKAAEAEATRVAASAKGTTPAAGGAADPRRLSPAAAVVVEANGKAAGVVVEANGTDPRVAAAFTRWLAAFTWFMKKVTYRHVRNRRRRGDSTADGANARHSPAATSPSDPPPPPPPPLLIKSPVHTARLGIWLRLFPRARFIYVHRHPLEVFQSAANMADTYYWYTYLQRPTDNVTNDFIMDQYDIMYRSYMSERGRVPAGRLVEVGFSELEADPMGVLRRIYSQFGWDEQYDAVVPRFQSYIASLADFKKNHFNSLTPPVEAVVRERWAESFRELGYS